MSNISAVLLIPLEITESMIATGTTVPVVDTAAGEQAWDSGTSYTGTETKINHEGWLYSAVAASTNVTPGTDPSKWRRTGPSNRMAALDSELNTITRHTGEITYVLRPGFFTGLTLQGMVGDKLEIEIYDRPESDPDAELVESWSGDLFEQALGLYELLFMPLARRTQFYMQNLPLYPDAEVHISITSGPSTPVEVALIALGHWDTLIGSGEWGGTEYDAELEVRSYSYLKRNDDGSVTRVRRGGGNNVACSVVIPADEANHAAELLHQVQGRPVAFIASGLPRYEYLNGFGDVSGTVRASGPNHARINLTIDGAVQGARN